MIHATAHAKINFFLEITGQRPDGYHTLSTVFQTISLGDELTFRPAAGLSLTCSEAGLPTDDRNLVMQAARRLQEALKETRGAKIHLVKKVPMGAGLGGGSADAAATLLVLLKLWKRRMPADRLAALALTLGADVPFFLQGGLCLASGIGEKLKPLAALPKTWMVLVYPSFGVSTKEAYGKVKLPFADPRRVPSPSRPFRSLLPLPRGARERARPSEERAAGEGTLFNRFESLIFPDHPELPRLKRALLEAGASAALMSGSGSSVFGLAASRSHAAQILTRLQKNYNQCWLVHTI